MQPSFRSVSSGVSTANSRLPPQSLSTASADIPDGGAAVVTPGCTRMVGHMYTRMAHQMVHSTSDGLRRIRWFTAHQMVLSTSNGSQHIRWFTAHPMVVQHTSDGLQHIKWFTAHQMVHSTSDGGSAHIRWFSTHQMVQHTSDGSQHIRWFTAHHCTKSGWITTDALTLLSQHTMWQHSHTSTLCGSTHSRRTCSWVRVEQKFGGPA